MTQQQRNDLADKIARIVLRINRQAILLQHWRPFVEAARRQRREIAA